MDFYRLLSVSQEASPEEIKAAYHRALLRFHPDKRVSLPAEFVDIALIKEAYGVLSSPEARRQHNAQLRNNSAPTGPRPAQVISLEEFGEMDDEWRHPCRCGGIYIIKEEEMEKGHHLIGCSSCSEVVWVGYELTDN